MQLPLMESRSVPPTLILRCRRRLLPPSSFPSVAVRAAPLSWRNSRCRNARQTMVTRTINDLPHLCELSLWTVWQPCTHSNNTHLFHFLVTMWSTFALSFSVRYLRDFDHICRYVIRNCVYSSSVLNCVQIIWCMSHQAFLKIISSNKLSELLVETITRRRVVLKFPLMAILL